MAGLILYWRRIRKFVTQGEPTDIQTDREFNCKGHSNPSWIVGLSGPIYYWAGAVKDREDSRNTVSWREGVVVWDSGG